MGDGTKKFQNHTGQHTSFRLSCVYTTILTLTKTAEIDNDLH